MSKPVYQGLPTTSTIGKCAARKTSPDGVVTEFPGVTRTHLEAPAGDAAIGPVKRRVLDMGSLWIVQYPPHMSSRRL